MQHQHCYNLLYQHTYHGLVDYLQSVTNSLLVKTSTIPVSVYYYSASMPLPSTHKTIVWHPTLVVEVHVPSQKDERSRMCVLMVSMFTVFLWTVQDMCVNGIDVHCVSTTLLFGFELLEEPCSVGVIFFILLWNYHIKKCDKSLIYTN